MNRGSRRGVRARVLLGAGWRLAVALLIFCASARSFCQMAHSAVLDSDRDGMSDELEQRLLVQFLPVFNVAKQDCSHLPSEFDPADPIPTVKAENGTIYGQVFPAKGSSAEEPIAEVHFYHLW